MPSSRRPRELKPALRDSDVLRFGGLRSTSSAALMLALGHEHGLTSSELLHGTALHEELLRDPAAEIAAWQELQLVYNLTDHLGDSAALGLRAGTRYHLTSHGIWGFALLGCKTVREAVRLGLRYLDLTCAFAQIRLEERDGEGRVVLEDAVIPEPVRHFLAHRDAAAVVTVRRDLVGGAHLPMRRFTVRAEQVDDPEAYRVLWGRLPEFGAEENLSVFDARFLDLPLPQANEHAVRLAEEQRRQLLARRSQASGIVGLVRAQVLQKPGVFPDMEQMARQLGMSSRTLRRRLNDEQTSYREVVEQVRLALADELLRIGTLSRAEIAARLGYSDVSSFLHAFKRMTGSTPARFLTDEPSS